MWPWAGKGTISTTTSCDGLEMRPFGACSWVAMDKLGKVVLFWLLRGIDVHIFILDVGRLYTRQELDMFGEEVYI